MRWIPWWLRLAAMVTAVVVVARAERPVQLGAGLVVAVVILTWLGVRLRRPKIRDWRDAEMAAARWLRKVGCRRVALTGGSADGGIDIVTTEWAVQVKHTAKRVGRPAVQQLVGAALTLDRYPALFSTSGFSAPACAYALEHDVALFDLELNGSASGLNRAASRVGTRTRRMLRR